MTMSIIEPNTLADGTFSRASTGTFYGSDGLRQTAAINVPRLNYTPTSLTTAPQLLVEAAATNLALRSDELDNAYWTKTSSTVTANASVGADGTLSMDKIVESAINALHAVSRALSVTAGVKYSLSADVKAAERTVAVLALNSAGFTAVQYVWFDLLTGTVTKTIGTAVTASSIASLGGGVYRISVSAVATLTNASCPVFVIPDTSPTGTTNYLGDGTSGIFAGALQFEVGAPTSQIPTTTVAVTRAADIVSATGLIYSDAVENDFPLWVTNTPQIVGDKVIRTGTHRIYQRLVAGTTATAPELDAINWLDIAPTNRWAMFDKVVGTMTSATGALTVVMRPGAVSGIALLEMTGQKLTVVMKDAPGGKVVYSKTVALDSTLVTSVYDWFYKPYEQLRDVVMLDLPSQFVSNELTITISGTGTVGVGVCKFGELTNIGQAQYGARVGITSFSKKGFDAFGNALITKRGFSKTVDLSIITEAGSFGAIFRKLASLDAVECIYIGSETAGLEPLIAYGFFKDFGIVVDYPHHHLCNLSIETLV